MLCFDKLKLISHVKYVQEIKIDYFVAHSKGNELLYYKYQLKAPYSLLIMVNYLKAELVIEFTSKILKERCIDLINYTNIRECLYSINELQVCNLDVENILADSCISKCDITKDVICTQMNEVIQQILTNRTNYKKWICKEYRDGISLENIASTPRHKKRLIIYDKGKELKKAENGNFLSLLSNREEVEQYFGDKVRFELNINTMAQIRDLLNIPDNTLYNVLHSEASPILIVLEKAIKNPFENSRQSSTLKDYERELLIKSCGYNLNQVEMVVRSLISKKTPVSRIMQPYRELFYKLTDNHIPVNNLLTLIE